MKAGLINTEKLLMTSSNYAFRNTCRQLNLWRLKAWILCKRRR